MFLKYIFDRLMASIGLLFLWPVLLVVAILIRVKMPGGPVIFKQNGSGAMANYSLCTSSALCLSVMAVHPCQ